MTEKPTFQLQVGIDDEMAQGQYINMASIAHNETEFVIDLIYVQPAQSKAKVRSRVITSPKHVKRLVLALQENLRRYEQRFGTIELTGGPDFPTH